MAIFLVPANSNNAFLTLGRPVEKSKLRQALGDGPHFRDVISRSEGKPIYCWAMRSSKKSVFGKMKPGDEVAFAVTGTGHFNFVGTTFHKIETARFSSTLWDPALTDWTLVFFLHDVENISVDKTDFLVALGYDKTDRLQGARPVKQSSVSQFLKRHGSIRNFLKHLEQRNRTP